MSNKIRKNRKRNNNLRTGNNDINEILERYESPRGPYVIIDNGQIPRIYFLDRMLAETFLPRPKGWNEDWVVIHKNGDFQDISLENLQWTEPNDERYIDMIINVSSI